MIQFVIKKSRSDITLLTVYFNLRRGLCDYHKSRRDDTVCEVSSLRDFEDWISSASVGYAIALPTVNKVLSHAGHFTNDMKLSTNH